MHNYVQIHRVAQANPLFQYVPIRLYGQPPCLLHLAGKIPHSVRHTAHPTLTASWRENTVARAVRPVELGTLPSVGSGDLEVRVIGY